MAIWRRLLIDWPATAATWYVKLYRAWLIGIGLVAMFILFPLMLISLVLWLFGIRWGW